VREYVAGDEPYAVADPKVRQFPEAAPDRRRADLKKRRQLARRKRAVYGPWDRSRITKRARSASSFSHFYFATVRGVADAIKSLT
jgi:hypothetical protein